MKPSSTFPLFLRRDQPELVEVVEVEVPVEVAVTETPTATLTRVPSLFIDSGQLLGNANNILIRQNK